MPLESSPQLIEDLNSSWPEATDLYTQGDDHLRFTKYVLAIQFPGANGQGFDKPIIATEDELNYLGGLTSNLQDQLDAVGSSQDDLGSTLSAEYGTRCLFAQGVAPTGWTQVTDYTDYQLRVVNTAGAGTGGSDSPFTHDWSHTHSTGEHTLSTTELPEHNHPILTCSDSNTVVVNTADKRVSIGLGADAYNTFNQQLQLEGSGDPHTHGDTVGTSGNFRPKYLDFILAENTEGTPPWDTDTFYGYARSLTPIRYWRLDDIIT